MFTMNTMTLSCCLSHIKAMERDVEWLNDIIAFLSAQTVVGTTDYDVYIAKRTKAQIAEFKADLVLYHQFLASNYEEVTEMMK